MAETASPPPVPPPVPPPAPPVVPPPLPSADLHLDREHPWPGLISFTEADHSFFFGREREVAELARVIRQKTLTVFFGKSGLGKSSILRAGVSPLLRESEFVRVYIRLNHDEAAPPLEDQVEIAIEDVLAREKIDGAKPVQSETLWEYFHKKESDWWDPENRLVKPVLIFDQFEELLTLGQSTPERAVRSAAFLTELEDLVENRPPAALQARFEAERGLARSYDLGRTDYRVVLTLREDFLPDLEGLRERLRAIMFNRVRLLPMSGEQAMDVVLKPGGHLVDEDVAVRIVDFVSSSERSRLQTSVTRAQLAKRSIEPALLSVALQELNNRRIRLGQEKITAELVGQTNPTEIFHDFYLRGLAGMDGAVREFIEDSLLTSSGARNRIAEEDALTKSGMSPEVVTRLIDRRIIQRETTGNTKWLELTHDTLADVVRSDRTEHHQQRQLEAAAAREAEVRVKLVRARKLVAAFAVLFVIAFAALWLLATRVESQANETVKALKKEMEVPAPGAPARVIEAVDRLSADARHFFFVRQLRIARGQALAYGARILYFNGWIKDGYDYSDKAIKLLENFRSDSALLIARASARYARGQGRLEKGQLDDAEDDFGFALKLLETGPEQISASEENNERKRMYLLARLGAGEVKLRKGLRTDAAKIFSQVRAEARTAFPNVVQENAPSDKAVVYEVSALRGLGLVQERNGQARDNTLEEGHDVRDFLEEADTTISNALKAHPDDIILRDAQAETAYYRIFFLGGRQDVSYSKIATRLRDAVTKGKNLFNLDQQNRRWKLLLAEDYRLQGMLLQQAHEDIPAVESFEKMSDLTREIQESEPSWYVNNYNLAIADSYLADCVSTSAGSQDIKIVHDCLRKVVAEGKSDFQKATALLDRQFEDFRKIPDVSSRQARGADAVADYRMHVYRSVREQLEKLIHDSPRNTEFQRSTAVLISQIGDAQLARDRFAQAITDYNDALRILNNMPKQVANLPDFKTLSAFIYESLGGALLKAGGDENKRLALDCRSKALAIRQTLKADSSIATFASWASACILVGDVYLEQGNREKAQDFYETAIQAYDSVVASAAPDSFAATPDHVTSRTVQLLRNKTQALNYIGFRWRAAGDLTAAARMLRLAIESAKQAFAADPLNIELISFLKTIKGDDKNPNWEKFCNDQLSNAHLPEADKATVESMIELLKQIPPDLMPTGASVKGRRIAAVEESQNWETMPLIPGSWRNLGPEEQTEEIGYLMRSKIKLPSAERSISRVRTLALPFYPETSLFEAEVKREGRSPAILCYVRSGDTKSLLIDLSSAAANDQDIEGIRLNGQSLPIHTFNSKHHPILDNEVWAAAYLRFFCTATHGEEGAFRIIDSEADLHWQQDAPLQDRLDVQRVIFPLKIKATPEGWEAKGTVAYSNALFYALFRIWPNGRVDMLNDTPVASELRVIPERFVDGFRVVIPSRHDLLTEMAESAKTAIRDKRWTEAIASLKSVIAVLTEAEQKSDQDKNALTVTYLELSWCQLQLRDFAGALSSADTGLKIDPGQLPLETNRAHALLFLGRTDEAEEIYRKYIGRKVEESGRNWEDEILNDLDELEKNGLTHPEFDHIRKILKSAQH